MLPDITVRQFRAPDIDDIVGLFDLAAITEPGIGPIPKPAWERFIQLPINHNGRDFRVALACGQMVGFAESHLKQQAEQIVRFCKIVVDPGYRLRGIGTMLLADLAEIEPPNKEPTFQTLISTEWPSGLALVTALGFTHIERSECAVSDCPLSRGNLRRRSRLGPLPTPPGMQLI